MRVNQFQMIFFKKAFSDNILGHYFNHLRKITSLLSNIRTKQEPWEMFGKVRKNFTKKGRIRMNCCFTFLLFVRNEKASVDLIHFKRKDVSLKLSKV